MKMILVLAVALAALAFSGVAEASDGRRCAGSFSRSGLGALIKIDRLRAQRTTSCAMARYLVRTFLRAKTTNFDCAAGSANEGYACVIRNGYECNVADEPRGYCMNQGYGVTFRERDYSTG
jgi:hypothetical protein